MADGGSSTYFGFRNRRSLPLFMQSESAECGLACLAMIARYHGHDVDLASLRRRFDTSLRGAHLGDLIHIAQALGFQARPLRVELDSLSQLGTPCILHWNLNHFVTLRGIRGNVADIHDPASGAYRMPLEKVSMHFTGIVLEMTPSPSFAPIKEAKRVSLRSLAGEIVGLKRALLQVFGLALAIEVLALLAPFQIQWVVDQVLVSTDTNLLAVITLGFLAIVAMQTGLAVARGWAISWLGATLNAQWVSNLFSHLMGLPLDYFQKRHIGDVVSRFGSLTAIQNTLTGSFVESVLDGLMGSLALIILCLYSMALTGVVVGTFVGYALLRRAAYHKLWLINEEQLIFAAKQQSELMESVRGIQAIKLANKQGERHARFANATIDATQREMHKQRITLAFGAINQGLFGTQRLILISLGAWFCLRGTFSAGVLVAFVAYADQFASKIGKLVDKIVEFRMLRLHAERVADIALAEPEQHLASAHSGPFPEPCIEIHNLSFRYAQSEPWILRNLDLRIEAGESVAIVGPSGCGKSTLAKLILGLLEPTEGSVLLGGIDIRRYGLGNYRDVAAAVMQDDQLFAGSIADNICFFDPDATLERIEAAARAGAIHDDIVAMPMTYESLVGDMGSSLSGGQKQRVILARALYRNPKILVLDEATSHLDLDYENLVNSAIKQLRATRIVIAHRRETICSADRIIKLG